MLRHPTHGSARHAPRIEKSATIEMRVRWELGVRVKPSNGDHCPTSQQPQHRPCRGSQTNAVIHCCQKITCAPESSDAVVCDSACDAVSESSRFISRVRSLMYSLVRE